MPSYPKNYPFYGWMPKPLGIIILLFFFLPILTVGGVYSVNSTEMMSRLGIISEHISLPTLLLLLVWQPLLLSYISWCVYGGRR